LILHSRAQFKKKKKKKANATQEEKKERGREAFRLPPIEGSHHQLNVFRRGDEGKKGNTARRRKKKRERKKQKRREVLHRRGEGGTKWCRRLSSSTIDTKAKKKLTW